MIEKLRNLKDYRGIYQMIEPLPRPEHKCRRTQYASIVDKLEGKIVERVYAFRYKNKKTLEVKEVIRRIEGLDKILVKDMYLSSMGGYLTIWEEKRRGYYGIVGPSEKWEIEEVKYYKIGTYKLFGLDDLVRLDKTLKYCNYGSDYTYNFNIIDYINTYRVYPELEIISKMGIGWFAYSSRLLKMMKTDGKFRKWVSKNLDDIQKHFCNYTVIKDAYKRKITIHKSIELQYIKNVLKEYKLTKYFKGKEFKYEEYIKNQNQTAGYYKDYLDMALEFVDEKEFVNDTKYLFPNDLTERHDFYTNIKNEQKKLENAKKDLEMQNVASKYNLLEFSCSSFMIIIPTSYEELLNEGKTLSHCVASGNRYIDNMLKEKYIICFLRKLEKPEEPFYTIELDLKTLNVLQCRTKHNATATEEVNQFLSNWESHLKNNSKQIKKVMKAA